MSAGSGWFSWKPLPQVNGAAQFYEAYTGRWGHNPAAAASGAYETIYAIKAALGKAGSFDANKLVNQLENIKIPSVNKINIM